MPTSEEVIFTELFKAVCRKCFGMDIASPLSEPESKNLSNEIEQVTGLVIGWKSLKNYSLYIFEDHEKIQVNPSVSTLDTLARYLCNAPPVDELKRKQYASHYPYWFEYRDSYLSNTGSQQQKARSLKYLKPAMGVAVALIVFIISIIAWQWNAGTPEFEDDFNHAIAYPGSNGWMIKDRWDSAWNLRTARPSHITLFTLPGDNIPNGTARQPAIRNLLFRKLDSDCFIAEIHFTDFMPVQNWQQAGLLFMEDSTYQARSLRVGLVYNDFFGGYKSDPEISVQVLASTPGNAIKPEVVVQKPVFTLNINDTLLIKSNLRKSALRVEKKKNVYRFLFASGSDQIFAFQEIAGKALTFAPRYIAIYASSGNTDRAAIMRVEVDKFLVKRDCGDE